MKKGLDLTFRERGNFSLRTDNEAVHRGQESLL